MLLLMGARLRFAVAAGAFAVTFPPLWPPQMWDWHPLRILTMEVYVWACETGSALSLLLPLTLLSLFLPLVGAALCALALLVSRRPGHRPAVAPALTIVTAIHSLCGVAGVLVALAASGDPRLGGGGLAFDVTLPRPLWWLVHLVPAWALGIGLARAWRPAAWFAGATALMLSCTAWYAHARGRDCAHVVGVPRVDSADEDKAHGDPNLCHIHGAYRHVVAKENEGY